MRVVLKLEQSKPIKQGLLEGTASNTDIAVDETVFVVNEKAVPTLADEYFLRVPEALSR